MSALPGEGTSLALTIDDGTNSEVVAAFIAFAVDTGVRLTFFPNGCYRSWEDNAAALRPLVDSGQVAIGNHTWSHPDLTTLSDQRGGRRDRPQPRLPVAVFGVRDSPFFRPPFGARDERTDRIAADQGHPTVAMWNGTLGDSRVLTPAELMAAAQEWFTAQTIVVGHANHSTVTGLYGDLVALIHDRRLRTVTLADVWATPDRRLRGSRGPRNRPGPAQPGLRPPPKSERLSVRLSGGAARWGTEVAMDAGRIMSMIGRDGTDPDSSFDDLPLDDDPGQRDGVRHGRR